MMNMCCENYRVPLSALVSWKGLKVLSGVRLLYGSSISGQVGSAAVIDSAAKRIDRESRCAYGRVK